MKINQKTNSDGKVVVEAFASAAEVTDAFVSAYRAFVTRMGLQPEKGKTVNQVVEERLGIKDLDSVVRDSALQELIPIAIDMSGQLPAYPPEVKYVSAFRRGQEVRFSLEILPKVHYELTSYEPVSITVAPFDIDETLVDRQLEQLASRNPVYVKAQEQRAVQPGDCVLLEMESFDGEKRIPGLSSAARTYVTSKGFMPSGFDDQLMGMEPGQTKTFDFEGPDVDVRGNEVMQKVKTTVTVLEIQEETIPEMNDAWVAANMPVFGSLADLRADITKSLEKRTREEYDAYCTQLAIAQLADRFEGRIPDEAYESMRENVLVEINQSISAQGITQEEYIEQVGGQQQFSFMVMMQVREMLVQGYVLDSLYEHEKLSASKEDYLAAARQINPKGNPEDTMKQLEASHRGFILKETAQRHAASAYLLKNAIITVTENE